MCLSSQLLLTSAIHPVKGTFLAVFATNFERTVDVALFVPLSSPSHRSNSPAFIFREAALCGSSPGSSHKSAAAICAFHAKKLSKYDICIIKNIRQYEEYQPLSRGLCWHCAKSMCWNDADNAETARSFDFDAVLQIKLSVRLFHKVHQIIK